MVEISQTERILFIVYLHHFETEDDPRTRISYHIQKTGVLNLFILLFVVVLDEFLGFCLLRPPSTSYVSRHQGIPS